MPTSGQLRVLKAYRMAKRQGDHINPIRVVCEELFVTHQWVYQALIELREQGININDSGKVTRSMITSKRCKPACKMP